MARILAVVPVSGVENTGAITGAFKLRAQVPAIWQMRPYGYLLVEEPDVAEGVSLRVVRSGDGGSHVAAVPRWHLAVSESPRGPLRRNAKSPDLLDLLLGLPDCVLLVEPGTVDSLHAACTRLDYSLTVMEYQGRLATQ